MADWRVTVPPGRDPEEAVTGAGGGIKFSNGLEDIAEQEMIFLQVSFRKELQRNLRKYWYDPIQV